MSKSLDSLYVHMYTHTHVRTCSKDNTHSPSVWLTGMMLGATPAVTAATG